MCKAGLFVRVLLEQRGGVEQVRIALELVAHPLDLRGAGNAGLVAQAVLHEGEDCGVFLVVREQGNVFARAD